MKVAYIHFYVQDSQRSRNWFINTMGFEGLGQQISSHTLTEIVRINEIIFLLSSPLNEASPVATYLNYHPSGVADIAFYLENLALFVDKLTALNIPILENELFASSQIKTIKIQAWGNLNHTLIDAQQEKKLKQYFRNIKLSNHCKLLPNSHSKQDLISQKLQITITDIDHVVLNVERNQLKDAVNWYKMVFDFQVQQLFKIETDYSSLYSEALIDQSGQLQFNINEPTSANSQIQDFLNFNNGSGIQHIALSTQNIIQTVQDLRLNNLPFLSVSPHYYHNLEENYHSVIKLLFTAQEWQQLKQSHILLEFANHNPQSLLMQIFTLPIFEQPTFFLELIERRHQAQGFGQGNFMALFQAIEELSKHHYLSGSSH